jgi:hypothetical protein
MAVTYQNFIHEEIKRRMNLAKARYDLVQNPSTLCPSSKNYNTQNYNSSFHFIRALRH